MKLNTIKFIKENKNWKELLQKPLYNLTIKEDECYYLLKYNQFDSDFSNEIVKECRGLIIDKNTLEPIALSFKKFWEVEVEELADDIDWESAKVQEKIDGSKVLIFYNKYKEQWQYATSSNLNAYEADVGDFGLTFGELFEKALKNNHLTKEVFENTLKKNYCYTFELVAPENRVVVEYKNADLYLIGIRNCDTFEETITADYINSTCYIIKTPKEYPLKTLDDCIKATQHMTYNEEGYVVVDKNWHRIKIKSPAWKIASHMRFNDLSRRKILEIIKDGKVEEILKMYPEYKEYFDEMRAKEFNFLKSTIDAYYDIKYIYFKDNYVKSFPQLTRKDYAQIIMSKYKNISSFLFQCLSDKKYESNYTNVVLDWWNSLTINEQLKYLDNVNIVGESE